MTDERPIGFLDSGVGGLSLMKAARRLLPAESFVMLADGRWFPYGDRDPSSICDRTERLTSFLIEQRVKLIVIACNTASVYALDGLRASFPEVPFVGVVPVVKTLASRTRSGTIALLSTPGTAGSAYLAGLVGEFASGLGVVNAAGAGLAEAVERGQVSGRCIMQMLESCLADVCAGEADVLGLACTHYLFLRRPIKRLLGPRVRVFDPARPVARRIRQVLTEREALAAGVPTPDRFYTTGDAQAFSAVAARLLRRNIQAEPVDLQADTAVGASSDD